MSQFNVEKKNEGEVFLLLLSGQIDEDVNFNNIDLANRPQIAIDLDQVASINSCGIREWIKWIRTASPNSRIIYRHCPKVIVDQINMVAGFLPENASVESFYVPYYCENSGTEKMILFNKGKEFKEGGELLPPPSVKDEKGEEMEMDVIEAKYFKFLKKG